MTRSSDIHPAPSSEALAYAFSNCFSESCGVCAACEARQMLRTRAAAGVYRDDMLATREEDDA